MTKYQLDVRVSEFAQFLKFYVASGMPQMDFAKCQTALEEQFEKYDLSIPDVIHMLKREYSVKSHPCEGVLFQVIGQSVDDRPMAVVCCPTGLHGLKIVKVWAF